MLLVSTSMKQFTSSKEIVQAFVKMHFMNIQIQVSARNSEEVQKGFNNKSNIQSNKVQSDDRCQVSKIKAQAGFSPNKLEDKQSHLRKRHEQLKEHIMPH